MLPRAPGRKRNGIHYNLSSSPTNGISSGSNIKGCTNSSDSGSNSIVGLVGSNIVTFTTTTFTSATITTVKRLLPLAIWENLWCDILHYAMFLSTSSPV
jgi:hypothetical protein